MEKIDLKSLSETEVKSLFKDMGHKPFRADQVLHWIYNRSAKSFDEMDNVPKAVRDDLNERAFLRSLEEVGCEESMDGTVKWLFKTLDGYFIETVLIPRLERNSVCVSTQVGCAMGCKFCRTARMGLKRHLNAGEILEQFIKTNEWLAKENQVPLTNIIYMGMGEPLHNYNHVKTSVNWLHHQKYFGLSRKRITISTSGVVPNIQAMADDRLPANLAVSLNGTNDEMRKSIMPITDRYPLDKLLEAVDNFIKEMERGVTFEYILIKDITCTPQAAKELLKIIRPRKVKVNAIVINESDDPNLLPPSPEEIEEFMQIIREGNEIITIRQPRGRDIKAACGQLAHHTTKDD
jgi:23S rRNA (adenine2503-C2)-methyltransferase|tara:strand:- start:2414 stop:3460 length:1047 start_codon:yes stop_codon:yes gene_type:complete